jgi:hypothetical protein
MKLSRNQEFFIVEILQNYQPSRVLTGRASLNSYTEVKQLPVHYQSFQPNIVYSGSQWIAHTLTHTHSHTSVSTVEHCAASPTMTDPPPGSLPLLMLHIRVSLRHRTFGPMVVHTRSHSRNHFQVERTINLHRRRNPLPVQISTQSTALV